jgi:hypothetical protein
MYMLIFSLEHLLYLVSIAENQLWTMAVSAYNVILLLFRNILKNLMYNKNIKRKNRRLLYY